MSPLTRHVGDVLRTCDQLYLAALVVKRDAAKQTGILKSARYKACLSLIRFKGVAGTWKVRKILERRNHG